MPHRTTTQSNIGKTRQQPEKAEQKRGTQQAATEREKTKMAGGQVSYGPAGQKKPGQAQEHRADTERMARKGQGTFAGERSGAAGRQDIPAHGERRGVSERSGGALSDEPDITEAQPGGRGADVSGDDLTHAGFSKPSQKERGFEKKRP